MSYVWADLASSNFKEAEKQVLMINRCRHKALEGCACTGLRMTISSLPFKDRAPLYVLIFLLVYIAGD